MKYIIDKFRKNFSLKKFDPADTSYFKCPEAKSGERLNVLRAELETLQELLYANSKNAVLIVLQGTDASGKDGTIKHVFSGVNPEGVDVVNFKPPTAEESAHDFLWRIHKHTPAKGRIMIFNRSQYEDVIVPQVHNTLDSEQIRLRYKSICNFEKLLCQEGTIVLKFFLHIGKREQLIRFRERLDTPAKRWKLSQSDIKERRFWNAYQDAFSNTINNTATDFAPWHIVPADKHWFRNLFVMQTITNRLGQLKLSVPAIDYDPSKIYLS